jgi:uncharacterized paraquat-inducible protein A
MAARAPQRNRPAMSIFRRKKQTEQRMSSCPKCLQKVPAESLDCPVCGADLRERPPVRRSTAEARS